MLYGGMIGPGDMTGPMHGARELLGDLAGPMPGGQGPSGIRPGLCGIHTAFRTIERSLHGIVHPTQGLQRI